MKNVLETSNGKRKSSEKKKKTLLLIMISELQHSTNQYKTSVSCPSLPDLHLDPPFSLPDHLIPVD